MTPKPRRGTKNRDQAGRLLVPLRNGRGLQRAQHGTMAPVFRLRIGVRRFELQITGTAPRKDPSLSAPWTSRLTADIGARQR